MPYIIEGRMLATGLPGWDEWDELIKVRDLRAARIRIKHFRWYANSKSEYRITHNGEVVE